MSLHLKKFVDRLQHFEQRGAREFSCPISDAKNLHSEITRVLIELEELRQQPQPNNEVIAVEMQGGSF
jgi:hypothetical protein